MNSVVHFEMPAKDKTRMSGFYHSTFGWKTHQLGADMNNYVVVTTTEVDKQSHPVKPGAINGGFYDKPEDMSAPYPTVVIGIPDIEKAMKDIKAAGGEVLGEPVEIKGFGMYVSFLDTEGNRVSMMQPNKEYR